MKHQYSIDELKHRENLIQARLEDEQARREELEEHKVCSAWRSPAPHRSLPLLKVAGHRASAQFNEGQQDPGPKTCLLIENRCCVATPGSHGAWKSCPIGKAQARSPWPACHLPAGPAPS